MQRRSAAAAAGVAAVVLAATLGPSSPSALSDFSSCLICGERGTADAILNVLLFMPLGAALAVLLGARRAFLLGAGLSLFIESAQYWLPDRHSSLGDLLFNTLGTLFGVALFHNWGRIRRLDTRASLLLASGATLAACGILALGLWLLAPAPPKTTWYGQWTPRLGSFETYDGRVLRARLGGMEVPSHRLDDSEGARGLTLEHAVLEVEAIAGNAPRAPAPIVAIADEDVRQVFMLAASRADVVYRVYRRGSWLRLDAPDLRFFGGLAGVEPGDVLRLTVEPDGGLGALIRVGNAEAHAGLSVLDTWALLIWPETIARSRALRLGAGLAWLAALFTPALLLLLRAWRVRGNAARVSGDPARSGARVLAAAVLASSALFSACGGSDVRDSSNAESGRPAHRVAVLGDSDSHSYRDHVSGVRRGGAHHDVTYQWTEILDATRAEWLDQGAHAEWGTRGIVAKLRDAIGLEAKTPRKADFRWNYARSGAGCASLVSAWPSQTRWLVSALRAEPEAWEQGVVVIRIGINDLGQDRHLEAWGESGLDGAAVDSVEHCMREIEASVHAIRDASNSVRIVLVGIADDSSWPYGVVPARSPEEVARIRAVLDHFDDALRALAARTPRAAFLDDRRWYYDNWADRDSAGHAQRAERSLGGPTPVTNTQGDAPTHLALVDGHAGTVANGFWAREFLRTLDDAFGWDVPPLTDAEIAALADPDGRYGLTPAPVRSR